MHLKKNVWQNGCASRLKLGCAVFNASGCEWRLGRVTEVFLTIDPILALCSLGMPPQNEAARRGAYQVIDKILRETCDARFQKNLVECDRCVVGMILQIAVFMG